VPVVLVASCSALAYAVASVLQQRVAARQPASLSLHPTLVLALAQQPLWLGGLTASAVGLLLQLVALAHGSLTVVQPVLVCGLIFAMTVSAVVVQRRRLSAREWTASLFVTAGVVLFIVEAGPGGGRAGAPATTWLAVSGAVGAAVVIAALVARRRTAAARAVPLAGAAGIANALSAAFAKSLAHGAGPALRAGPGHAVAYLAGSWQAYALVACLAVVLVLVQSAFQAGPITWSLPAITAFNPLAAGLIGVTVLGEHVRTTPGALAGESAGLLLALGGVVVLAGSSALSREPLRTTTPVAARASRPV
jgi:drug/metabolite transporter (DMT)-like permease